MLSPEGYEKKDIDAYLVTVGAAVFKPATFGFGASGCPDRLVCHLGRFIGIEVKREGKTPTALQRTRMAEIRQAGGIALWGTAEKVIRELKEIGIG